MTRTFATRSGLRALCVPFLASALLQDPLHGAVLLKAEALASIGNSGPISQSAISGQVSWEYGGAFEDRADLARSQASFGVLSAYAEGHYGNHGPNNIRSVFATGTARFTDDITIDAPGRTGQSGFMTFKVDIHGSLAASGRAAGTESIFAQRSYAQTRFTVATESGGIRDDLEKLYADGTTENAGLPFLNRIETIVVPFTYGTPFTLSVGLQAATNSRSEFGSDCVSDIGNTLEWGGIVSVTDGGSNAVTDYTTVTGSGTDYAAPILDQPHLELVALSPGQLQLSWSTNYPAFTLQSSGALSGNWETVTNGTGISGEQLTLSLDASGTGQLFRLRKN